ncbi:PLD nuclease N-terminal domain-containing protein [Microbacterium sp. 3J1]|uniref:PLD nuclease N-terminal domain-containing protein n=1 Tax=Microbacterium sp. 3J1 TaxID=861269 RepID=UPI000B2F7D11|nr:PLD nuclease N-terminal domain-containing protein [Microbacterium sp. 3J1]
MPFLFSLLVIALMIGAMVDIIRREDSQVRFLPKLAWIIIVVLLPLIGSLLWFAIGREYSDAGLRIPRLPRMRPAGRPSPQPGPPPAPATPIDTRTTEQQIADLDREIEEWRLRAEIDKRRDDGEDSAGG